MKRKQVWEIGAVAMLLLLVGVMATAYFHRREQERRAARLLAGWLDKNFSPPAEDLSEAKRLLALGADVNTRGKGWGCTLLTIAAGKADIELVQFLLDRRTDMNPPPGGGFNLDVTPLVMAAKSRSPHAPAVIKRLVAAGAPVNARGYWGETALMKTVGADNVAAAGALLAAGADVDARDQRGMTALGYAKSKRHPAMIRFLQQHGAKQ